MLSVNGSPLANPLTLDLSGWLSKVTETDDEAGKDQTVHLDSKRGHKRTNSIMVRSTSQNGTGSGAHSRTNSQNGAAFPPQGTHSRTNSRAPGFVPTRSHPPESAVSSLWWLAVSY